MSTAVHEPVPGGSITDRPAIPPLLSVAIIGVIAVVILVLVPRPAAISVQGWRMLAIFVCTIAAMMLRPIAGGAAVLMAVVTIILTGVLTPAQAMAGYGNATVWLVLAAFFISRAIIGCGLARRLALLFIRAVGGTSLGLGYALVGCDIVMATVIPGNSART